MSSSLEIILAVMVHCTIILLSLCTHRLRTPVYAYFQVSRSQPYVPATAPESQTGNPTSGTDSDSDSSAENEEVVVQAEEPEANIPGLYFI